MVFAYPNDNALAPRERVANHREFHTRQTGRPSANRGFAVSRATFFRDKIAVELAK
jgi:hypothetical protein